ncbi:MAG UNVERIFIED_CONTAM: hypothetical protein LVT10_10620 [Anaerolineae bacterium]
MTWFIPQTRGYPIAFVGLQVAGEKQQQGMVALDYLTWDGEPDILLDRPYEREQNRLNGIMGPSLWKKASIDGLR